MYSTSNLGDVPLDLVCLSNGGSDRAELYYMASIQLRELLFEFPRHMTAENKPI